MVEFVTRDDGRACIFAYGQTGSGKTYTMEGVKRAGNNLFQRVICGSICRCSVFEIYGGRCQGPATTSSRASASRPLAFMDVWPLVREDASRVSHLARQ